MRPFGVVVNRVLETIDTCGPHETEQDFQEKLPAIIRRATLFQKALNVTHGQQAEGFWCDISRFRRGRRYSYREREAPCQY